MSTSEDGRVWSDCLQDAEASAAALDIYTASNVGDVEVVAEILSREDNPQKQASAVLRRNLLGWNILMYAAWQGDELQVRFLARVLQAAGVDASAPSAGRLPRSGRTPLMVAARFGHFPVVRTLCKEEFVNTEDFRGETALHHAVHGGNELVVTYLLDQGADVNVRDKQGVSVLDLSKRHRLTINLQTRLREAAVARRVEEKQSQLALLERDGSADLSKILNRLSLGKYLPVLRLHEVDLDTFLTLGEDDLRQIGVSLLGPRRKMTLEIRRLRSLLRMDSASR